jgi:OOP family OmpA-OmpF porin
MKLKTVTFLIAAGMCSSAFAQDQWYVSADAGRSDFHLNTGGVGQLGNPSGITSTGVILNSDKKDSTFGLRGGYRLNSNFAVEAGYSDLGSASFNGARSIVCTPGNACPAIALPPYSGTLKATAWDAALVGRYGLDSNWSLYGKAGVSALKMKTSMSYVSTVMQSTTNSRTSTVPMLGAGLAYQFTPTVSMQLEWNRHFNGSSDANNGKADIDAYTLGVSYHF